MKNLILIFSILLLSNFSLSCEFFDKNSSDTANTLMGKKSQFYHAYKQGRCVLEEALGPLSEDQREIIANLIAKSYKIEN